MKLDEIKKYAEEKDSKHKAGKSFKSQIKIKHNDGSTFKLRFAKFEINSRYLIVYTEHNGILYFIIDDLDYVKYKPMFSSNGRKSKKKYEFIFRNFT